MEKFIDSLLKIGLEYGEVVSVPDFESVRAGIPESTESVRSEDGSCDDAPVSGSRFYDYLFIAKATLNALPRK